jgi:hypothetical protein
MFVKKKEKYRKGIRLIRNTNRFALRKGNKKKVCHHVIVGLMLIKLRSSVAKLKYAFEIPNILTFNIEILFIIYVKYLIILPKKERISYRHALLLLKLVTISI